MIGVHTIRVIKKLTDKSRKNCTHIKVDGEKDTTYQLWVNLIVVVYSIQLISANHVVQIKKLTTFRCFKMLVSIL